MGQAGAALRLVSSDRAHEAGEAAGKTPGTASTITATHTSVTQEHASNAQAGRSARHDLLKEWMGSHTRILGLWLDRLLEEGDDGELVSMIHRQHAWLSMMQARMERG